MHHHGDIRYHHPSRALSWLALIGLAAASWRCVSAVHTRRMDSKAAALPEPLQVWEDEGGQNQMPDSPPARPQEAQAPSMRGQNGL